MKRYLTFFAVVGLAIAVAAPWAVSQEGDRPEGRRPQRDRRGGGGPQGRGPGGGGRGPMMGRGGPMRGGRMGGAPDPTRQIRDLTEAQRKQIDEFRRKAQEKIRAIQQEMNEEIRGVLNPEQKAAFDEALKRITHRGPDGVILTDEQKKVFDDARAQAREAGDPQARGEIMQATIEKIRATYTDEQKKQAAEAQQRFGGQQPGGERPGGPRRGGGDRRGGPDRPERGGEGGGRRRPPLEDGDT